MTKALAMGADAVAIASSALIAQGCHRHRYAEPAASRRP